MSLRGRHLNPKLFTSNSDEWETPQDIYDRLDREFNFTLDPCATDENHKCDKYYTAKENGLIQDWSGETAFMNPPYGREIGKWIKKAYIESQKQNTVVICLIPARTDTMYWHNYIMLAKEIRFIKGRLKFANRTYPSYREDRTTKISPSPFPSAIIIFDGSINKYPLCKSMFQDSSQLKLKFHGKEL